MSGYPCCRRMGACGDCAGTAPDQYQLTVPAGTFYGGGAGGDCDEACDEFNGVYLLDYLPGATAPGFDNTQCIWESADFEACYYYSNPDPELGTPAIRHDDTWYWRVYMGDPAEGDGHTTAHVILQKRGTPLYGYEWHAEFDGDCSATLNLTGTANGISPHPGCHADDTKTLVLEASS